MHRNLAASILLFALASAGCGGGKHGSPSGIPGGGGTDGTGGTTTGDGTLSVGGDVTLAKGRTHQFQAILTQAGASDDCSTTGQWSSSDPAVASVSGGVVTALALGQTTITASCAGIDDGALLVVTDPEVDAITIAPAAGELPVGLKEKLVASATLSDLTTADVSADVVWSSNNTFAFTVSSLGVIEAKNAPNQSSTITAFHTASGKIASATRTVTSATLSSIAVTASAATPGAFDPAAPSVPLGIDVQFDAIGTFSDGASAKVTPSVTWSASPADVVSFSTTTAGLASTLKTGSTTVTATSSGVAPASTTLTVTAPVVTSIAIDQDGATLVAGETLQLTGTASFSDDSTQDVILTGWVSSATRFATVSDTGLLTAVTPGFATISASYVADGQTFTDSTQVSVIGPTSSPVLSYLSLTPGSVKGGGKPLNLSVAITSRATTDTVVALASSASTYVPVPATVTIPAGKSSVQLKVTTTRPTTKQKVKITATLGGRTKVATVNLRN